MNKQKLFLYSCAFILIICLAISLISILDGLLKINNNFYEEIILEGKTAENACINNSGNYYFTGGISGEHRCYINNSRHDIYYYNNTWIVANGEYHNE